MHGHLVAVEVGVEGGADQRVDADGFAFDQHGLKRLDAQAVQRGRAVEQHRMLADDLFQHVPDQRVLLVHHFFGLLDGGAVPRLFQPVVDERFEEFQRHLFGQAALVQLQLRPDHDHRAAGVVHALAEQVLPEAALLAFERVGERLQRAVVGSAQHTAPPAVVEQRINGFLQHPLFVADDHFRRPQLHQLLQAVVAVDHAPVEVVQVGGGKPSAVQRHQRAQFRRQHRDHVQDHPLRAVARLAEGFHHPQALGSAEAFGHRRVNAHLLVQFGAQRVDLHLLQQFFDGLGAHADAEVVAVLVAGFAVVVLAQQFALLERGVTLVHHHVGFKVEDALQVAQGQVEQLPDARGDALEEPDVADGRGQLNVRHALAANLVESDLDAAFVADDAAVLHPLVLAAQALPVAYRAEDTGAEQAVPLRLEGAVIDGLRLLDLAV